MLGSLNSEIRIKCSSKPNPARYRNSHDNFFLAAPVARFFSATIKTKYPMPTPRIPKPSTTCGGLKISTSNPNELCHQLSKGADVTIVTPPHAVKNAPSGPRNPQTFTEADCVAGSCDKVVEKIR